MSDEHLIPPTSARAKLVPGHPGYLVTEDGEVWSRVNTRGRLVAPWHRLKPVPDTHGALRVMLTDGKRAYIACLVLEAFTGPCPAGMECCHWDGDPSNNNLSNLRWDTHKANIADAVRHGRHACGESCNWTKLTADVVRAIRRMREVDGLSYCRIGRCLGLTREHVRRICLRLVWNHLA